MKNEKKNTRFNGDIAERIGFENDTVLWKLAASLSFFFFPFPVLYFPAILPYPDIVNLKFL